MFTLWFNKYGDKFEVKRLKNALKSFKYDDDVIEKENLDVVKKYDVDRLDELLDVIKYVKDNKLLDDATCWAFDLRDKFYDEGIDDVVSKEIPFIASAIEILGGYYL